MTERTVLTDITESTVRMIHKGVPQGGVLSPLLYCIYVAEISKNLPKSIGVSQFADDIALWCNRSTTTSSKNLLEKAINKIFDNLRDLGLELNPNKTTFVHFNKRNIKPGETELEIKIIKVKSSSSVRFLGVIIDYKLSFKEHVNFVEKKCLRSLNIIKYLRGTWWGASAQTLIILYKSFVRSIIVYANFVYFPTQAAQKYKLEKIQYTAIRLSLGYRNSMPTNTSSRNQNCYRLKIARNFYANVIFLKSIQTHNC